MDLPSPFGFSVKGMENNGREEGQRFQSKLFTRGHWRPSEDAKLRELVSQFGPQNWNVIARNLEGRSGKSCRLRWFNQLDPKINRKSFSEEEEERLLAARRVYGNKWALIARLFPGRTDNAVKNHWHVIESRKIREKTNVFHRRRTNPSSSSSLTPSLPSLTKCYQRAYSDESTITSTESASTINSSSYVRQSNQEQSIQFQLISFSGVNHLSCEDGSDKEKSTAAAAVLPFIDFLGIGST